MLQSRIATNIVAKPQNIDSEGQKAQKGKVHNMNEESILSTIEMLAMSQGSYGRLYSQLMAAKNAGSAAYDSFINEASTHCSDPVGLIMWIEE